MTPETDASGELVNRALTRTGLANEFSAEARAALADYAQLHGLTEGEIADLVLAAHEALNRTP